MDSQKTSQPTVIIDRNPGQSGAICLTVCGLDPDLAVSLCRYTQAGGLLQSLLGVRVFRTGAPSDENLPNIVGSYQVLETGLRFIPLFPFEPDLSYRASFDPRPLGRPECSEVLTVEFSLPKMQSALPTEVQHIFPSSDKLPENLLRFYVGFSNSMQRGRAEAEIVLLGPDGEPARDALYRAPVELWDRSMRCLTVLLDPGRLKRGVRPNRELGPPLKAGLVYTLVVSAGMLDFSGRRLTEPVYKRIEIIESVREHIAVEQWKVVPPARQSHEPLALLFPRPLDWALLKHTITIASADGQSIDGQIVIDQCERRWSFTPASLWVAGPYQVRVASSLEDVCGNSIIAAFDRPLRSGSDLKYAEAIRSVAFHVV